jgi:putative nucleotidyltransferase with HDIG domain
MSVPGRTEAAALILSVDPAPRLVRHSRAVAEVAAWLGDRVSRCGTPVDRRLVESAALLHDIDKALPRDHHLRSLPHGEGSAAWLRDRGHKQLAPIVANHPVTCLAADGFGGGSWSGFQSIEAAIVAYADKRARQRLIPMSERFAIWRRKYRPAPAGSGEAWSEDRLAEIAMRAERLERDVCDAAGVRPQDVARLRWTGRAFIVAEREASAGQ